MVMSVITFLGNRGHVFRGTEEQFQYISWNFLGISWT